VRTIYLFGVDFKMKLGKQNYHFEQARAKGSVKNNNNTYKALNARFAALRPIFEANGLNVFNCNSESGLTAFDFTSPEDAIVSATKLLPDFATEPTEGLYDRRAKLEAAEKEKKKQQQQPPQPAQDKPVCKTLESFIGGMQ